MSRASNGRGSPAVSPHTPIGMPRTDRADPDLIV
jgi:hypothetical protein